MAEFRKVKLSTDETEHVWVNFDLVTSILTKGDKTTIVFEKGHTLVVKEKIGDLNAAAWLTIGKVKS